VGEEVYGNPLCVPKLRLLPKQWYEARKVGTMCCFFGIGGGWEVPLAREGGVGRSAGCWFCSWLRRRVSGDLGGYGRSVDQDVLFGFVLVMMVLYQLLLCHYREGSNQNKSWHI